MNVPGGNTLPNIGKRINWQLVTLVSGLAVAVSAAAGLGAFETDSAPPAPAELAASISRPAASQDVVQSTQPLPVIYIVSSQEQGLRLTEDVEADLLAVQGFDVPLHLASFLVISTPEEEQALNETTMEQLLLTEPAFEIVDLRN